MVEADNAGYDFEMNFMGDNLLAKPRDFFMPYSTSSESRLLQISWDAFFYEQFVQEYKLS